VQVVCRTAEPHDLFVLETTARDICPLHGICNVQGEPKSSRRKQMEA
jgi:hypothetical protein